LDPFTRHHGTLALLDWADVNTDLIIPARYLKRIERTGYGPTLFADKRYQAGGAPPVDDPEAHGGETPDFPLNQPKYRGASILVVGPNFGCGSSREHAVWAVAQAGYRVLIAPGKHEGFADIFEQNAFNNGLLPIELPEADWRRIADAVRDAGAPIEAEVDLQANTIAVHPKGGAAFTIAFEIDASQRERLLRGLDAIAETLQYADAIAAHEGAAPAWAAHPGSA
jgi:3-isopropylmalate/(R)-2-methylmalate dehydratase small subunit